MDVFFAQVPSVEPTDRATLCSVPSARSTAVDFVRVFDARFEPAFFLLADFVELFRAVDFFLVDDFFAAGFVLFFFVAFFVAMRQLQS